jgi:hypothetical protein
MYIFNRVLVLSTILSALSVVGAAPLQSKVKLLSCDHSNLSDCALGLGNINPQKTPVLTRTSTPMGIEIDPMSPTCQYGSLNSSGLLVPHPGNSQHIHPTDVPPTCQHGATCGSHGSQQLESPQFNSFSTRDLTETAPVNPFNVMPTRPLGGSASTIRVEEGPDPSSPDGPISEDSYNLS